MGKVPFSSGLGEKARGNFMDMLRHPCILGQAARSVVSVENLQTGYKKKKVNILPNGHPCHEKVSKLAT